MENGRAERREPKTEHSFQEKLIRALQEGAPELLEFTADEIKERQKQIRVIEAGIENSELSEFLAKYGVEGATLILDTEFSRQSQDEYLETSELEKEKVFTLGVKNHFSDRRLPKGYAYKGGAARALLLRSLGIDPTYIPRDFDVVRREAQEPYEGADREIAQAFMPEDYSTGYGVEQEENLESYFDTRDFTINEVLATDESILVTESCLKDTVRKIIRPTQFERYNFNESGELGPKMLSKILRFYAEGVHRWGTGAIEGVADWEFEENFIRPFWLALQLDRAFDVGAGVAEAFVAELKNRRQLPDSVTDAEQAAEYLASMMQDDTFYYRHAPTEQFDLEDEWFDQHLPKFRGHGKSRGES